MPGWAQDPHAQAAAEGWKKKRNFTPKISIWFPGLVSNKWGGEWVCEWHREVWGALPCERQLGVAMQLSGHLECHGCISFYFVFLGFFFFFESVCAF